MLMEKTAEKTAVEATAPPDDETPRDARRVSAGNIAYRYALVFVWVAMAIVFAILRPERCIEPVLRNRVP